MQSSGLHYFPLALPFILGFALLLALALAFIQIGILEYAYEKMGVERRYVFSLLFLSLVGSYVNIPVAMLPAEHVVAVHRFNFLGMEYVVPTVQRWPGTVIAVNLGGAVVPTALSLYLIARKRFVLRALPAVAVVAVAVHGLARPVAGVGIVVPTFLPPLVAVLAALALSRRQAPALAYVGGSLGTLIGADLWNLGKLHGLGAPIASIGGAGTFDGIFLTGIVAVLLA